MHRPSLKLNALLILIPALILSLGNIANRDKPTVSEIENRALKSRPEFSTTVLFSGRYTKEYEEYFADTFLFRDKFVSLSKRVGTLWSLDQSSPVLVAHTGANMAEPLIEETRQEIEGDIVNKKFGDPSKSLLVLEGRVMELHRFSVTYSDYYARFLNRFRDEVKDSVRVYSLLVPTQVEFISHSRYRQLNSSQKQTIDYIYGQLSAGIAAVDAYGELYKHKDQYIYFGTDHHWTALGAYYAYTAFMRARGVEPVPLDRYETGEVSPFLGFLYSSTLNESVKNNPDTVRFYKPFTRHTYSFQTANGEVTRPIIDLSWAETVSGKYGIFLSGDRPLGIIRTDVNNGKRIAIVKDSYGNAFVPFLLPHYEEIYVIDPRHFPHNLLAFVEKKGIDEVLFLNYVLVTEHAAFTDLLTKIIGR